MNAQDLRKTLEQTDDKLSIFASRETLSKHGLNGKETIELISDFLSDAEKLKLFNYPHFIQLSGGIKNDILKSVSDKQILLEMIKNNDIIKGIDNSIIIDNIKRLDGKEKTQLLHNQEFLQERQFSDYDILEIISTLENGAKKELLMDDDLLEDKLHLKEFQIVNLIRELSSDEEKSEVMGEYQFSVYYKSEIIATCSDDFKIATLTEDKELCRGYAETILGTLNLEKLKEVFAEHKELYSEYGIQPYEIISKLESERQKEFLTEMENCDLTLNEKKEIVAMLKEDVKQSIDVNNFPEVYKTLLSMPTEEFIGITAIDFNRNSEDYRGLDNILKINPMKFTEEQRNKFKEICEICPNLTVKNTLSKDDKGVVTFDSTGKEYIEAEEFISSVIESLKPEYGIAQKIAVIDNAIGKKISYSPNFNTETFNNGDCRALWKIISSGYGVCNGIAEVENYILNRIGIESEVISSVNHAFLKIKNIEVPLANGDVAKGNTILDPTWNLASHRYSGKPDNFFMSYEHARKNDIDINGKDHKCHKNDEELLDATLDLDDQSLKKLFTSVGLTDKDGDFPIKSLFEKSKQKDEEYANQLEQNINAQLTLISEFCPEFATCQNSSIKIIENIFQNCENLDFNRCVIDKVYNRTDEEKEPIIYIYIDSDELEKNFFFADKNMGQFINMSLEEFTNRFECYDMDLERREGIRAWEAKEQEKEEDLKSSSGGRIADEEEQER